MPRIFRMPSISTVILGSSAALVSLTRAAAAGAASHFDWDSLKPSWHLQYTKCYGEFECARIHMPLDWVDKSDNRTIAIAVLKVPAMVEAGDPSYGGTVMVNPGGPGDSGIVHMLKNGRYIQAMVDSEKHFEILSFDPRGVAFSTPRADCYTSEAARRAAEWQTRGVGPLKSLGIPTLKRALARTKAHGYQCASYRDEGVDFNIHDFTSTASVARDMLRLVDETDMLREKTAALEEVMGIDAQKPLRGGHSHRDQARLQYYGTSYGTILGNTFLSMFPGRVKRMMLDGVVIADDWVLGNWDESAVDTHHAIEYLYRTCFEAGPKCALKNDLDKSWDEIQQRVDALVNRLDKGPVPGATVDGPEVVIDGSDILGLMFGQLYSPLDFFDSLASTLAQAVEGNYTQLLAELVPPMSDADRYVEAEHKDPAAAIINHYTWMSGTFSSVSCGDTEDQGNYPLSHWKHRLERLRSRYPRLGVLITDQTIRCAGWQSHPKYRFAGPFCSPEADASDAEGHPSAPLLLLSSLYDPITPLESARVVARGHPGSRVLVQNSVGHCTLLASPSKCTKDVMRAYMANGTMPEEGTVCGGDCVPFEKCPHERGRFPR